MTAGMYDAKDTLIETIRAWRNRKTKIVKESEAIELSKELDIVVGQAYADFNRDIVDIADRERKNIEAKYKEWYQEAEFDEQYVPVFYYEKKLEDKLLPIMKSELLEMKEERYVSPKEDLFGLFFKSPGDKETEQVLEISYNCQSWREYAVEVLEPIVNETIEEYEEMLKKYSIELASKYLIHIDELIKEQGTIKDEVATQLSDEERKLQIDNDWFVEYQDQLRDIERG